MAAASVPGHFTLLYFAAASSYTKKQHDVLPAPLELGQLYPTLENKYPGIGEQVLSSCAVTLNLDYVDLLDHNEQSRMIQSGDEVAIIPPVSSG